MDRLLQLADYGSCPYIAGRSWRVEEFAARSFEAAEYERLLALGWRRSGPVFYRDTCPGCNLCTPIRLDAESFAPSASQRRLLRVNADVDATVCPPVFSEERYELYRRYVRIQHGAEEGPEDAARLSYANFLLAGPLATSAILEYSSPEGALLATGYIDVLPDGLSSVYFAFDPAASRRSLGTWSVLRGIELARRLGKRYYYLGFWVPGAAKMDYKSRFEPFEIARAGRWLRVANRAEALALLIEAGERA